MDELHLKPKNKIEHVLCAISKLSTLFWKIISASWTKLSKKPKNGIKISVGQAVLELLIKTCKLLFWSVTQELLGILKLNAIFEFLRQFMQFIQRASWTYPPQVFTSVHLFYKIVRSRFTNSSPFF